MYTSPYKKNYDNKPRKIGVEIELAGLDIHQLSDIIVNLYGGSKSYKSKYICKIHDSKWGEFGDFTIELDAALLKKGKINTFIKHMGLKDDQINDSIEDFIAESAMHVVPMEIVTPPIPLNQLSELEKMRETLRISAAEDTKSSVFNAFGLHLNPEVPSIEASEIRDFLRAFILSYEWLKERLDINFARRVLPYIDSFEKDYGLHIMKERYNPTIDKLIDDYLKFNPTRNRPLDMLPLFTFINKDKVVSVIDDGLTTARPTFHYRLPNCSLKDPNWSITREWNHWVIVERIAFDKDRLNKLSDTWIRNKENPGKYLMNKVSDLWKDFFEDEKK